MARIYLKTLNGQPANLMLRFSSLRAQCILTLWWLAPRKTTL